jgi:hypothetical protein
MSRTRKDAPSWVRANNAKEENRRIHHHHEQAGRPVRTFGYLKDENGEFVTAERSRSVLIGYTLVDYPYWVYEYSEITFINGVIDWSTWKEVYDNVVTVERVRGYYIKGNKPEECTIDVPYKDGQDYRHMYSNLSHLCYPRMEEHYKEYDSSERMESHRSARRIEKSTLHKAAREYNSGEDMWGDDYEDSYTRQKFHSFAW